MSTAKRPNAAPDASCALPSRGRTFHPVKPWQKFCSPRCRTQAYVGGDGAMRGVVSKVSVMRRGVVSVVVRFDLEDRDRAQGLTPGDVIEVVR